MDYGKLKDEFLDLVKDTGEEIQQRVDDFIAEAAAEAAEDLLPPGLKEDFTVTTSTSYAYVSAPSGFDGILTYAGTEDGAVDIAGNLEILRRKYPELDETGDIEMVTYFDGNIYYQPIPSAATTIYLVGFNVPTTMSADGDEPSWLPSYLHREVIVYRAVGKAYEMIEDGVDGKKVNADRYNGLAQIGLAKAAAWISRRKRNITRVKYYV